MLKKINRKKLSDDEKNFRNDRCLENFRRLNISAKVFIVYLIWLGCFASYYALFVPLEHRMPFIIAPYLVFAAFNIVVIVITGRILKDKKVKSLAIGETFVMFCVFVIMAFGAVISFFDQQIYGHLMVYLICVIICLSYFLLSARQIVAPTLFTVLFVLIGIKLTQPNEHLRFTYYANIGLFLPLSLMISRLIYRDYKQKFSSILLLEKETQRSKMLFRELDHANHILKKLASVDELTGIANRRGLNHYLEISLEGCCNHKLPLGAIMVDIDFFKEYNDTYGHLKGDIVLKQVSEQLSIIAADISGLAVRWGGEEFVVIVCGLTIDETHHLCQDIIQAIDKLEIEHATSKISSKLTISIGACTMFVKTQEEITNCIECADKALYYAKEQGRHRYKFFDVTSINNPSA